MQWANQAQAYKLIEALKAIASATAGTSGSARRGHEAGRGRRRAADPQGRLVERIAHLLGERRVVPVDMPLGKRDRLAARRHGARRPVALWDLGDLDLLAKALGEKLREAGR
jgi:hypothetical protein